ncbi:MAG: ABC transporter ATP-binding protein [Pseudobutyrivibrio sp.]|nr:ABC transporter ATP-binding protein [Pseudobutyrivibrio sp.]
MSVIDEVYEPEGELITVKNLSFYYQPINSKSASEPIFENLNFNIYRGEFICVMGESGCGKSTLLNLLAGFENPTSGQVLLDDKEIKGIDKNRGVVFQKPPLYGWYSVRENVAFGPTVQNWPKDKIKEQVDYFLKKVGLENEGEKKVFELSGGMKQRAAIARALVTNPEILLMDEPFGALDALTRETMQKMLRDIWYTSGKTIFFITHDVDEALQLATRVIVLGKNPGRIVADIPLTFSRSIVEDNSNKKIYSEEFFNYREKILDLISIRNNYPVELSI